MVNFSLIFFHQNGKPVSRKFGDVKIRRSRLKMENLVPLDSGNYTCMVSNSLSLVGVDPTSSPSLLGVDATSSPSLVGV